MSPLGKYRSSYLECFWKGTLALGHAEEPASAGGHPFNATLKPTRLPMRFFQSRGALNEPRQPERFFGHSFEGSTGVRLQKEHKRDG